MPVDLQSLLIWVIAGGAAGLLSWGFDLLPFADEFSPAAKRLIMFALSALLSVGAVYLQHTLTDDMVAALNPYVTAVLALVPIFSNQMTHVVRAERDKKAWASAGGRWTR